MTINAILEYKGVIAILVIVGLFILERVRPKDRRAYPLSRWVKNFSLGGMNALLSPLLVIPLTLAASNVGFNWRSDGFTGGWWILLDILILDAWIYLWHRANHQIPFLWRFHQIHHLDQHLDVSSAVRFHFGEVILSAIVRAVFILLLDINFVSILIFETLVLICAAFQHSNITLPDQVERRMRQIIVTPSHHWIHHHCEKQDTDSNYATLLTIWDNLGRTRSVTDRTPGLPIGLDDKKDQSLLSLIASPLYPK